MNGNTINKNRKFFKPSISGREGRDQKGHIMFYSLNLGGETVFALKLFVKLYIYVLCTFMHV